MYRKCDYYKNGFEMLKVKVYRYDYSDAPLGFVCVHFHRQGEIQAFTATPLSPSFTINVINDEMFRLWSFIQERNWRGRIKDYDLIVGGQL